MDDSNAYYLHGYYGIPLAAVHNPPQLISLESLNPQQIETLLQLQMQCIPVESTARVRGWLDSQIEAPGSPLNAQDYFFSANYLLVTEADGDLFIRSEAL
jgi:hypothetical protein